jgi:predicted O-linked N-acetylglucosamine transferase (SPINDLY family)
MNNVFAPDHKDKDAMPETAHSASPQQKQDRMRVTIARDMPQCLVEANKAIRMGHMERAKGLLNDEAIEAVRQRLDKDPSRGDIMLMLAAVLNWTGQKREAYAWYQKCAEVEPNALVYNELAMLSGSLEHLAECIEYLYKAIEIDPNIPGIWVNLAVKLIERKQFKEGFDLLHKAIQREPHNPIFFSVYLFSLNYLPEVDPQIVFNLHKQWGKTHAPITLAKTSHSNTPVADRRLRIGYISPDFRTHSVTNFFEPLLDGHNHDQVEVYGYGNVNAPDQTTERLKHKFDHYRHIFGVADQTVAHLIERDGIDILVELAGHTNNHSLLVLARKPAPIQVTYLGYGETTGVEAIDYFLTDNRLSPPESQKFYTEQLWYVPGGLCYRLPEADIAVTAPPSIENGYMTFGSLTAHRRFNLHLLHLWADILRQTPDSKMILGFAGGIDDRIRSHYWNAFQACGISRERVEINGPKPYAEYLNEFNRIDILLDTFPENGGIYTCESLWMGVPVITLAGPRQISRYGLSLLSSVGLEHFAASTASDYVAKAVALANNLESLVEMRRSMRPRMAQSPFCDSRRYAAWLESAFREMWHQWCLQQGASVPTESSLTGNL